MARLPYLIPYDPAFLGDGFAVPMPSAACRGNLVQAGRVFDYIHFSLVMHCDRKSALYTAHNIDVSLKRSVPRTGWDEETRLPGSQQTGPEAYSNNPWDRGHLVRRAAVAWGSQQKAQDASDSSFFYTNAALQHGKFNQDEWLALEDWVLEKAGGSASKLCVFTGPIYTTADQFVDSFRIPSAFWKVVVLRDPTAAGDDLSALGFLMKQNEFWDDWNGASLLELQLYEVGLKEIGVYAGLDFGELGMLDEFEWRQARFRDRSRMRPVRIAGPEDIKFSGDRRRARGIRSLRIGPPTVEADTEATAVTEGGCGCAGQKDAQDERVSALATEVEALREMVDVLIEAQQGDCTEDPRLVAARATVSRIVGGDSTGPDEFPECACIGSEGFPEWFCSGVLIHPRVVVTAAHCAPDITKVYLDGRSINLVGAFGEVVEVERVVVHPDYDPGRSPSHDIALLILADDAQTAPVAIASNIEVDAEDNVRLVGFGYEHPTESVGFGTKRKVDVPLTNLEGLSGAEIGELEFVHGYDSEYELHAGRKALGKDSCNGDSGGPAYVSAGGDFKLAGVTSRAAFSSELRCGDGGIYTRAAPYLAWMALASDGLVEAPGLAPADPADPADPLPATTGQLFITAAQPNPAGPDRGNEWIEISNVSGASLALEGHSLRDRQGGSHELAGIISPRSTRRVILPGDSPVQLANGGDDIILFRGEEEIHHVQYSGAGSGEVILFDAPQPDTPTGDDECGGGSGGGSGGGEGGTTPGFETADPC